MASTRDNVYVDYDKRIIMLHDDVDADSISKINYGLIHIIKNDEKEENEKKDFTRKPIHFYINSYGGYITDMWSLIEIMLNSKTPIYTYCTGYAMSAGFKIFLAGHKRYISKHAKLLYHQISSCNWGKFMDMIQDMEDLKIDQKNVEEYILSRTKITQEKLDEVREKKIDWYIYSDEAIKLGVADEIIGDNENQNGDTK